MHSYYLWQAPYIAVCFILTSLVWRIVFQTQHFIDSKLTRHHNANTIPYYFLKVKISYFIFIVIVFKAIDIRLLNSQGETISSTSQGKFYYYDDYISSF